ncbi:MAG: hypothetical protein RIR18_662 [Pseudomonadota bacterium]|jgi:hypothetical protein
MNTQAGSNIVKTEFFVKASKPISACGKHIEAGDFLFIDTNSTPEAGKLVLCGSNIEAFTNQSRITGVVRGIFKAE